MTFRLKSSSLVATASQSRWFDFDSVKFHSETTNQVATATSREPFLSAESQSTPEKPSLLGFHTAFAFARVGQSDLLAIFQIFCCTINQYHSTKNCL